LNYPTAAPRCIISGFPQLPFEITEQPGSMNDMEEKWKFRPGTVDEMIFNDVVVFNEYRLPARFEPEDIVIDIGAHTGSFILAALRRGARAIYAVEADRTNLNLAAENLREAIAYGVVRLHHGAVWRSDENEDQLRFDGYQPFPKSFVEMTGMINTGNGSVIWGAGEPVDKIALDDLIDEATNQGEKRIRLLKLDCEGAEWAILFTSQRLHLVEEICGEFHEMGGEFLEICEDREITRPIFSTDENPQFTVERLIDFLAKAGFTTTYKRHRRPDGALEGLGLFFAQRSVGVESAAR
jgi:FkbM family methyltransferase